MASASPRASVEELRQALDRLLNAKAPERPAKRPTPADRRPRIVVAAEPIRSEASEAATMSKLALYRPLNRPLPIAPSPGIAALEALRRRAPHMTALIDDLSLDLRFLSKVRGQSLPAQRILLWGPAGSGKTWLAGQLLRVLSAGSLAYSAGGVSSAVDLIGQAPTFREADAGLAVRAIARTGLVNPAILVDEIDKAGSSDYNGSAHLALLGFLEPESARRLFDPFLQVHVDCSRIHWVFTANEISKLPEPLLSRLKVFKIQRPGEDALDALVSGFSQALADQFGLPLRRLPKPDDLLRLKLARQLRKGEDLRAIRQTFDREIKQRALAAPRSQAASSSPPSAS